MPPAPGTSSGGGMPPEPDTSSAGGTVPGNGRPAGRRAAPPPGTSRASEPSKDAAFAAATDDDRRPAPSTDRMALPHAAPVTTRSERYALGPGADLPVARIVAVALIVLALAAVFAIGNVARSGPSEGAKDLAAAASNPRSLLTDNSPHFLPTPVAALPPEANTGPPAPAEADAQTAEAPAPKAEHVKVANTGGVGAILRAEPPRGRQVAALRDGTQLDVVEHRQIDDSEWLRVRTPDGQEGWIFSRLAAPVD
jgi:Bacterial SH3 domain